VKTKKNNNEEIPLSGQPNLCPSFIVPPKERENEEIHSGREG
jgi:hypothetical protein